MPDLATLAIRVENEQAVNALVTLDSKLKGTGEAAKQATDQLQRVGRSAGTQKLLHAEIDNSIRLLRLLAAATNTHDTAAVAGLRRLIDQQGAWAEKMGASGEQILRLVAIENQFEGSVGRTAIALERQATAANDAARAQTLMVAQAQAIDAARTRSIALMETEARAMDAAKTRARAVMEAEAQAINRTVDARAAAAIRTRALMEMEARAMDEARTRQRGLMEAQAYAFDAQRNATAKAAVSSGQFRNVLQSLAVQVTGMNPMVARLAGLLGTLAYGSGIMAGAVAGAAALGLAWNKFTEEARLAKEKSDELIESLIKQRQAALGAAEAGQKLTLVQAQSNLLAAQRNVSATRLFGGTATDDIAGGASFGGGGAAAERRLEEAKKAVRQAELNLQAVEIEGAKARWNAANESYELEKSLAADRKRWADEDKKAADESLKQLAQKVALITRFRVDLSALLGNIDARTSLPSTSGQVYQDPGAEDRARQELRDRNAIRDRKQQEDQEAADKKFGDGVSKLGDAAARGAQIISQAIEYMVVQKVGGGGAGANFGAAISKGLFSDLAGGFAKTALGGAIFGPLVAGIGAAAGSLFDFGAKANAAAKAMKEAQDAATATALAAKVNSQGYETLEQKQARETASFRKQYDETRESLAKDGLSSADLALLGDLIASHARLMERLEKEDAFSKAQAREDLEVRALRARGMDKEADRLALELRQRQELFEAEKQGMDEAYIARLKEIHGLEAAAEALDKLTTSVRNAPSGFKIESYINRFATPRPNPFSPPPLDIPYTPERPTGPLPKSAVTFDFTGANITIDARDKTPKQAFGEWSKEFRKLRTSTIGLNAEPALALTFLPE